MPLGNCTKTFVGAANSGSITDLIGTSGALSVSTRVRSRKRTSFVSIIGDPSSACQGKLALILPSPPHGLRKIIDGCAVQAGIAISPILEVDCLSAIIDLVVWSGVQN